MEARFFRLSGLWFLGGLFTGLWMLGLSPLADGRPFLPATIATFAPFSSVRDLHVSWLVLGWLGMLAAGAVLRVGRGRRPAGGEGALADAAAAASAWLWCGWAAAAAPVYLAGAGPRWLFVWRAMLVLAVALAAFAVVASRRWSAARAGSGRAVAVAVGALLVLSFLVAPTRAAGNGAAMQLPSLAVFDAGAAVAVGLVGWLLLGPRRGVAWWVAAAVWAAAAWFGASQPLLVAACVLAAGAWMASVLARRPRGRAAAFTGYGLLVTALTALAPEAAAVPALAPLVQGGPTPLSVAASLGSMALAAVYAMSATAPGGRLAEWHWLSHVVGFSLLVGGLQAVGAAGGHGLLQSLDAVAIWSGALLVAVGASAFVLSVQRARGRRAAPTGAAAPGA